MKPIYTIIAAVVLVGLVAAIWLATMGGGLLNRADRDGQDRFAQCREGQIAGGTAQIGGPFELVNAQGQTVTDKDVVTQPSLLYFGYTFCPDVCPLDTARNAAAVDILAERGHMVTPVFISVDPERDTPAVVGDFASNLHERMIGLTGSPEQVKAASAAYKTYYKAHPAEDDNYLVDHSTFAYLVLPNEGFVEYFRREVGPEEMADRVSCFVQAAGY